MRTRINNQKIGPLYTLRATFSNAGHGDDSVNPFHTGYVGSISTMKDHNNGSAIRSGLLVMSDCELIRMERQADQNPKRSATAMNANGTEAKVEFSGDFAGYFAYGLPNRLSVDMGNAGERLLIEAYAKMNSSTTLGGEQLATMKQTIGMIRSPFKSLTGIAMKARKRLEQRKKLIYSSYKRNRIALKQSKAKPIRFQELAKALADDLARAAADSWLELRYGMIPLMIDTEHHIDYIKQKMRELESHTVRMVARSSKASGSATDSYTGTVGCGLAYVNEPRATANWSLEKRVTAGVVYSVSPRSNIEELNAHLGLRVRDVPSTLYELIPLSFVLDWAINVGDWLQAIVPVPGIQPQANWITTVSNETTTIGGISFSSTLGFGTNHVVSFSFPPGTEHKLTYTRQVNNSLSTTPLIIGKALSNNRIGDAAALSVQKFVTEIKRIFR